MLTSGPPPSQHPETMPTGQYPQGLPVNNTTYNDSPEQTLRPNSITSLNGVRHTNLKCGIDTSREDNFISSEFAYWVQLSDPGSFGHLNGSRFVMARSLELSVDYLLTLDMNLPLFIGDTCGSDISIGSVLLEKIRTQVHLQAERSFWREISSQTTTSSMSL